MLGLNNCLQLSLIALELKDCNRATFTHIALFPADTCLNVSMAATPPWVNKEMKMQKHTPTATSGTVGLLTGSVSFSWTSSHTAWTYNVDACALDFEKCTLYTYMNKCRNVMSGHKFTFKKGIRTGFQQVCRDSEDFAKPIPKVTTQQHNY